jgi:protoporphyrinogen oxidase
MYNDIKIVFQGKTYDYPLSITSILANMKFNQLLIASLDYYRSLIKRILFNPSSSTFEDWVINHFGKTLYTNFASERIPKLSILRMLKDLLSQPKPSPIAIPENSNHENYNPFYSYYPQKGSWQLTDEIKKRILSTDAMIHLNSRITTLTHQNNSIAKVIFEQNGQQKSLTPEYVVSTIPIPELTKVLHPLSDETKNAGLKMNYRELTLLFLEVNKPHVFESRLVYFHDPDVLFQRASETKFISTHTVPSDSKTSITLEITNKDNLSDDDIYHKSVTNNIVKQPYAYPIYDVDYEKNLTTYLHGTSPIRNLFMCGRQALFRYIDMDQCLKMGLAVAEYLLGDRSSADLNDIVASWSNVSTKS